MSIQQLLGKQRPLEYREAASDVLRYVADTPGNAYFAVQAAVAYGVILGKRAERERKKKHEAPARQ